ncbi:MAG: hypothetical protein RJQ04_20195 [Longimicrobiales bacterium]
MARSVLRTAILPMLLAVGLAAAPAEAQRPGGSQAAPDLSTAALVGTLPVRGIGPAVMSGRVVDIAVASSPDTRGGNLGTVFYIAAASGGVWKTTSGGIDWEPVFDDQGVQSIGDVAVAPSNSNIVWVGTGEANSQRSSSYGNGVYRSMDGGASWEHMGLESSQHVGRILVHPEDPDVVYVAAVGPLWAGGGERGLYRTTDGGETWELILEGANEWTGVTDIVMDPRDPDVMYAATYQRLRRAYSFVGGGPGTGIFKTTNGGETWRELTRGLPTTDLGRIGLDIARSEPNTLYAIVESNDEAGLYRSDDAGASWRLASDIESIPWYFGQIRVDPNDAEVVYHLGVPLQGSVDGGETWDRVDRDGVHVDHHALWVNPENSDHLILGNDGGLYVTHDRGQNWDFSPNLPISQFYAVGIDMAEPFFGIYGGLQDNSTWGGPSRTRASDGIFNSDWFQMAGGDGFYAAVDPTDPNIAYVESQNGNLQRYDRRTGDRKGIRPTPAQGQPAYRFNWSAPVHISPWDHETVYFAANHMFKSTDRGDSWTVLGEDLTRAIDRDSLPMMGGVPDDDAVSRHQGTAVFSNISDIDVSEVQQGLLITGSDDGAVAISTDDGESWTKQARFPGVPDTAYVSKVRLSTHDANVMYVTFDNHRSNDFRPYVIRSADQGDSWQNISADLPEFGSVRAFAEHHVNADLLFVGTEMGPFVSLDRGGSWTKLDDGIPAVRVDDLVIHPRENTLVVATHGRGFYLIDDLGPLQELAMAQAADQAHLFPVKPALQFAPDRSPTSGLHGSRNYVVENRDPGTTVSYMLPRQMEVSLEVLSPTGEAVRSLEAPGRAGLHHVHWDLTADAPYEGPPAPRQQGGGGGFGGFGGGGDGGAPVVPGTYVVRLTAGDAVHEHTVEVERDDRITLTDAQLAELYDIRVEQLELDARLSMALRQADEIRETVQAARTAMDEMDGTVPESLSDMADALNDDIGDIRSKLGAGGGGFFGGGDDDEPPTVRRLVQTASGVHRSNTMPSAQEMEALRAAPAPLAAEIARINAMVEDRLPALFRALDQAGVPWSPGRPLR